MNRPYIKELAEEYRLRQMIREGQEFLRQQGMAEEELKDALDFIRAITGTQTGNTEPESRSSGES